MKPYYRGRRDDADDRSGGSGGGRKAYDSLHRSAARHMTVAPISTSVLWQVNSCKRYSQTQEESANETVYSGAVMALLITAAGALPDISINQHSIISMLPHQDDGGAPQEKHADAIDRMR
jgi:hypothetical protein